MRISGPSPLPSSAEMPAAVAAPSGDARGIAARLEAKLGRFWEGMVDTMEERTGIDAIQHNHDRDRGYLARQGRALLAEISGLPDGPDKDAALHKLERFVQTHTKRIEDTYQRAMARETGAGLALDGPAFSAKIRMKDLL